MARLVDDMPCFFYKEKADTRSFQEDVLFISKKFDPISISGHGMEVNRARRFLPYVGVTAIQSRARDFERKLHGQLAGRVRLVLAVAESGIRASLAEWDMLSFSAPAPSSPSRLFSPRRALRSLRENGRTFPWHCPVISLIRSYVNL